MKGMGWRPRYDCLGKCELFHMNDVAEPLELSAPLAWRLAPALCRKDPESGEDCSSIHGFWQYLRLLGLASTPDQHSGFFRCALGAVKADAGAPRVLVSGSADYSMLVQVLAAFRGSGVGPDITVLDVCETPLELNRWYAERVGRRIEIRCSDISAYREVHTFDAVCTHSFLAELSPAQRVAALAKWRELLRPGGAAITVNRLRPGAVADWARFSRDQVQAFRDAVLRRAESRKDSLGVDPTELAQAAEIYASSRRAYPVRSLEEMQELFEHSGFEVEHLSCDIVTTATGRDLSGPTTPACADYARIVARRK
jgi:SAM-dependent methyltransferase